MMHQLSNEAVRLRATIGSHATEATMRPWSVQYVAGIPTGIVGIAPTWRPQWYQEMVYEASFTNPADNEFVVALVNAWPELETAWLETDLTPEPAMSSHTYTAADFESFGTHGLSERPALIRHSALQTQLRIITALEALATPSPWHPQSFDYGATAQIPKVSGDFTNTADAHFIAALRNAWPTLLKDLSS